MSLKIKITDPCASIRLISPGEKTASCASDVLVVKSGTEKSGHELE